MNKYTLLRHFLLLTSLLPLLSPAQEKIYLTRIDSEIILDGVVNEAVWDEIEPFPLVMYQPTYGGEVTVPTEIRVAYDSEYIYMSGRLYTLNSDDARGNSLYRDRWSGDDTFAIILDTFNDNENALWFFTNPLGTRYDAAISDDASSFNAMNFNWNSHWEVATTMSDEGWFAEFRIPFSTLPVQDDLGRVEMGLIVYRYIAVTNERYIYPDIPPHWSRGTNKPSQAQDVILEKVYRSNPLYITPYALGGIGFTSEINGDGSRYQRNEDQSFEAGIDFKYNLTSNLNLDATINTDFAQVEADDEQINLTRFSLFFPEKRQFFQERSGIFDVRFGRANRLFHSRRIGLHEGEQIRILSGARLVGRVGKWDLGVINMQTAESDSLPAENFGVLRLRRNVVNPLSYAGSMLTTRVGMDGSYNFAYAGDATLAIGSDVYFNIRAAQTIDQADVDAGTVDLLQSSRLYTSLERRRQEGFIYDFTVHWSGSDYNPGIGFESREDVLFGFNGLSYHKFVKNHNWLRKVSGGVWSGGFRRNSDGTMESGFIRPQFEFETIGGWQFEASVDNSYEDVLDTFAISDKIDIAPDKYWFHEFELELETPEGWRLRPNVEGSAGSFYGGMRYRGQMNMTWILNRHVEFRPYYQVNYFQFDDADVSDIVHLARIRMNTAFNRSASVNTFLQYNGSAQLFSVNARFRYNFGEGQDFWLVYNEGINTSLDPTEDYPTVPLDRTSDRTFLVKYTHTFIR